MRRPRARQARVFGDCFGGERSPCWCRAQSVVPCRIQGLTTVPRATTRAVHRVMAGLAAGAAMRAKRPAAHPAAAAAAARPKGARRPAVAPAAAERLEEVTREIRVMAAVPEAKRATPAGAAGGRPASLRAEWEESPRPAERLEAASLEAAESLEEVRVAGGEARGRAGMPESLVRPGPARRARRRRRARRFRPRASTRRIVIG
jgi:hypothetical protein